MPSARAPAMASLRVAATLSLAATSLNAAPVVLEETAERWHLHNGLVELTIDKQRAAIVHLATPGGQNLVELAYQDANGSPGGFERNAGYQRFGRHMAVTAQTVYEGPERVDVMLRTDPKRTDERTQPFWGELHYVLRRDEPGFYVYWLRWHEPSMPPFDFFQNRFVLKARRDVFDRWQTTAERAGSFPTSEVRQQAVRLYDATYQMADGAMMTKYANAESAEEHHVCGLYSSAAGLGLWQINPSNEYVNGGPTKRNLLIHQADPILLHMVQSLHFLGRSLPITGDWHKLYGPVFYYLNQADTLAGAWTDAQKRSAREKQAWPYTWVLPQQAPDAYPVNRGSVTGVIQRADDDSPEGAYAILGADEPNWQFQGRGYLFWDRADAQGRFAITRVRPGTYTLYSWQPGLFRESTRRHIVVNPGKTADIGDLTLQSALGVRPLWRIGTPDRTAGEFRHGRDYRTVYLHKRYQEDFPHGVHFVVGISDPAKDWNYYQPGGEPWTVRFTLDDPPRQDPLLTIAVAAAGYKPPASIRVGINQTNLETLRLDPGDSALWRLGNYDAYQIRTVTLPAADMTAGTNVLTLTLPDDAMWVMYDFLSLNVVQ